MKLLETVNHYLKETFPDLALEASVDQRNIITLKGECDSWARLVEIGHQVAALEGVRNVISDMTVKDLQIPMKDYQQYRECGKKAGIIGQYDLVIVGAGVCGCGIARELAKYDLDILVIEKSDDVATGATKANNGHIHPGHAVKPGTLKAKLNVRGNELYDKWSEELGFEFQRCGSMGIIVDPSLMPEFEKALKIGKLNGVPGIEIISGEKAAELEPGIKEAGIEPVAALWIPSMGLVEPYQVTVALAENAAENGVEFLFDTTVADVLYQDQQIIGVVTDRGIVNTRYLINCAGVYSDEISAMAGDRSHTIHPRRGTIAILDKRCHPMYEVTASAYGNTIRQEKNKESKGGGMCRTPEWNILLGPSAVENPDKENLDVTAAELDYIMSLNQNPEAGKADIIRLFAGTRPADFKEDFLIEMSEVTHGLINVAAIQSPGLASAPAIAEMVEGILKDDYERLNQQLRKKEMYQPIHNRKKEFRHLSRAEQDQLIQQNPAYGRVICRCETITEGEIIDAIRSPVLPRSVDAIKRRTRAGMGRCQGGFCQPRVLEILARELGTDPTQITLKGGSTNILLTDNRKKEG